MVEYNTRHYPDMGRELVESSLFWYTEKKSGIDIPLFEKLKKPRRALYVLIRSVKTNKGLLFTKK